MSQVVPTSPWLLPIVSLLRREVVRFVRQRSRVVGALGTPLVFWLLIGSGLKGSFRLAEADGVMSYLEYAFPGTIVLIVLFTAIFSMISIIEDRREGFLQGVLASPVRRSAISLGKILGSSALAVGQAMFFLALAPLAGIHLTVGSVLASVAVLVVVSMGLSGLGFLIAWPMDSTQGFHAVMNLFLMPMWLLSGAFFPATGAAGWLGWIMMVNPLTYAVAALRHALYPTADKAVAALPSLTLSIAVTIIFSVLMVLLASRAVSRRPG